jgi:hypothetical protein
MLFYIIAFLAWGYAATIHKGPKLVAATGWVLAFVLFSFLSQIGSTL